MRARPLRSLAESIRILRRAPLQGLALGTALVLGTLAVSCGFGALAAPYFGAELFAAQIAAATGGRPERTRSWLSAVAFLLVAVLLVASAAWVGTAAFGPELPDVPGSPSQSESMWALGGLSLGFALLGLAFILPFLYAPLILVDRGGSLGGAAVESARLVMATDPFGHYVLSLLAHLVQTAPVLCAGLVAALWLDPGALPVTLLVASPLLFVSVPVGQGMVTASWIRRRGASVDPSLLTAKGRPPQLLTSALVAVLLAPLLASVLMGTSLLRPSRPRPLAALPAGETVIDARAEPEPREHVIPDTALALVVSRRGIEVDAFDGGGAGRIPAPSGAPLRAVRVIRVRSTYAIVTSRGEGRFVTFIDRAGVRLDDGPRARLADAVPLHGVVALALVLLLAPLFVGRALAGLGEVRRAAAAGAEDGSEVGRLRKLAARRSLVALALVAPIAAAALLSSIEALAR